MEKKEVKLALNLHSANANSFKNFIAVSPMHFFVASSNAIVSFNRREGKIEGTFGLFGGNCSAVCFDGDRLFFGSDSGIIGSIDLKTKQTLHKEIAGGRTVKAIDFFNGKVIAAAESALVVSSPDLSEVHRLEFGSNFVETFSTARFKNRGFLFLSLCDFVLHIYEIQPDSRLNYCVGLTGHENKIKSISVKQSDQSLLIATASMDNYIRLWKLSPTKPTDQKHKLVPPDWFVSLESVLLGHTDDVTDVKWNGETLVSCGSDCAVLFFAEQSGIWMNTGRLGQLFGSKNALLAVCVAAQDELVALGFGGALYRWKLAGGEWKSLRLFSGHFQPVNDICWDSQGAFLVSAGEDKTSRVFIPSAGGWAEASRAQIHGHSINTITTLPLGSNYCDLLVCGADEKTIRLLEPPAHFVNFANVIGGSDLTLFIPDKAVEKALLISERPRVYKAYNEGGQEVLGLMTKSRPAPRPNFYTNEEDEEVEEEEARAKVTAVDYSSWPSEDFLASHTLWPEVNKLYGHGYELSVVAFGCGVLVSACRSQSLDHSALIFWNVKDYKVDYVAKGHNYTVLDIKFARDSIVTVSKDRNMILWQKNKEGKFEAGSKVQAHARVIHSVAVCDQQESKEDPAIVLTGSRDKKVKLWLIKNSKFEEKAELAFEFPVRAVEYLAKQMWIVGLENGQIILISHTAEKDGKFKLEVIKELNEVRHWKAVNKLRRRPASQEKITVASCGDDHAVKIFDISF